MRNLLLLLSLMTFTLVLFAQTPANQPVVPVPTKGGGMEIKWQDWHQIHLDKPIQKIEEIFYEKDQQPIENEISRDRKSVILKNYHKKGRIKVRLIFEGSGGVVETIVKSSCFIDPVIPL